MPLSFDLSLDPFRLEAGPPLPRLQLSGWWWGPDSDLEALKARTHTFSPASEPRPRSPPPAPRASPEAPRLDRSVPTILFVHALTGDARVGGEGGWWAPLAGPGRPFDPSQTRLLCFNNLGSCYGSFGPTDSAWPWSPAAPVGRGADEAGFELPAPVTTWDQARAVLRALDALGVGRVRLATGGSLGGMIVLALGALAPDRFEGLLPVAASASASPWIIGFNHIARQVMLLDPDWPQRPSRGFSIARQLAMMTYRAEPGLANRQGRLLRPAGNGRPGAPIAAWSATWPYAQETYLEYQGQKLVARFDDKSYLVQLAAMDHHDLERRPPEPSGGDRYTLPEGAWEGLRRLTPRIDAVGIDSDNLYLPDHMRALTKRVARGRYHEITSPHGHDAFLIEWDQLEQILDRVGAPTYGSNND